MLNIFKTGIEFNNLAKSMNGMNVMLQDLIPRIEKSYDKSEFTEDIFILAYIAKRGVLDRLEKYNWTMDAKIIVPTIERGRITLAYALMQTVGKVTAVATQLEMDETVQEIMDGGKAFYQIEKIIPSHLLKNI